MARSKSPARQAKGQPAADIFEWPSSDLLSVGFCAYIGASWRYQPSRCAATTAFDGSDHAAAALAALLTAFGGGTLYYVLLTVLGRVARPGGAWAWGAFAWQQPPCLAAAAAGLALAVPLGHPLDARSVDARLFKLVDCANMGILVVWAKSKLQREGRRLPAPLRAPAVFLYCAGGGTLRNVLWDRGSPPPSNFKPNVLLPMAIGAALFAPLLRRQPARSALPGVALVTAVFALLHDLRAWGDDVALPGTGSSLRPLEAALVLPVVLYSDPFAGF